VQQVSLTQKATEFKMDGLTKDIEVKMDGLKKYVESKMDCLKKGVETKMNDVEAKMDDLKTHLKTDLTKFLQEMLTNGKRVVKETHDENKRNVNHDFIDSNFWIENPPYSKN